MKNETFINYKNWRYAKLAAVILAASFLYYFVDVPVAGHKGNTFVGMFFGILSASGILYLTYFGIRKRSYRYGVGSLAGTLSAHIWLGLILILLVPLHAGFSLNFNLHTLTYLVMVIVVLSGIFGAIAYRIFPQSLMSQRGKEKPEEILKLLEDFDTKLKDLSNRHKAIENLIKKFDLSTAKYISGYSILRHVSGIDQKKITDLIHKFPEQIQAEVVSAIRLLGEKRSALKILTEEVRASTLLKIWLYIHIPFTILLLILLFAHIFSVLYYWT